MNRELKAVAVVTMLTGVIVTGFFSLLVGAWYTLEGGANVRENGAKLIAGVFLLLVAGFTFVSCLSGLARMDRNSKT